ncbi:MAG TPA: hypothetical protein VEK84_08215 [Terriglobales bacterium]|nr:hypothetical protein [Terriglobales bacterium]
MKCADVRQVLPEVMENRQDGELEAHLKSCPACSELVSDLKLISSEASRLAGSEEPSPRVWTRIAAELRAEGLIWEPEAVPASPVPVSKRGRRWTAWWLVPAAAALAVAGSYVVSHKPATPVAQQQISVPQTQAPAAQIQTADAQNRTSVARGPAVHVAPQPSASGLQEVAEPPSAEDQQFLSEVSDRNPGMRVTYENQLRSVNAYIREAQAYLDQNPGDEDARQHLMEACQQKAMLYQLALDQVQ